MTQSPVQADNFGEVNFGNAQLGDKRRVARLVRIANQMRSRPGGTLPQKLCCPSGIQATYRLFSCASVTHSAVLESHRQQTISAIEKSDDSAILVVHDGTELDYSNRHSLKGLGQIGNGSRRGYICHNSLALTETGEVVGLLNQILHRRVDAPKNETVAQRRSRDSRESRLWLRATENLPANWRLVDVCDQGADTFEFLEHESQSGRRFVIRSAYNRSIIVGHGEGEERSLVRMHLRSLKPLGTWKLWVTSQVTTVRPKKKGKKKIKKRRRRVATMMVSSCPVQVLPPTSRYGQHGNDPLAMWAVRVWEANPPKGEERLEWFLLTNQPIASFDDAYQVVGWYEKRWVVEEYHKGLKTGCQIESLQFTDESRLKPAIALLSIVSLTLLNLRDRARRPDAHERKATTLMSKAYVKVLSTWRHGEPRLDWSIADFYYALARLGGHQNRKSDHPPGWQILWRGWAELQAMVLGYEIMRRRKCDKT